MKKIDLKDIRFWIVLFFLVRLFNIMQPPLEIAHNWRQVTGNMVARNFYETDNNILFPRLDFAGELTGITGTEFPLMNYIHYGMAEVFGFQHWYGRLINLLFASLGIWYFFKIIQRFFNTEHAFYAAFILLFSLWFSYSRKSMPDIFSISLCIISLYYGLRFLYDKANSKNLLLYFSIGTIGVLSKIPSAYLFSLFLIPFLDKNIALKPKMIFAVTSILLLTPSLWWYFSWVPYLNETYEFHHYFMGDPLLVGAQEIFQNIPLTLKRFYADAFGYIGFFFFLWTFIYAVIRKEKRLLVFLIPAAFFLIYMFKAGFNFPHHTYYILPFIPVMAFLLGWGFTQVRKKNWVLIGLALIAIENVANQQHDFYTKESEKHKLGLEPILDQYSARKDLIAISGGPNPQEIYFAHRKGWIYELKDFKDGVFLEHLKNNNCKLIVVNKHMGSLSLDLPQIYLDDDYLIYSLE